MIELAIIALGGTIRFGSAFALGIKLLLLKESIIERFGQLGKEDYQEMVRRFIRLDKGFFALSASNLIGTGMMLGGATFALSGLVYLRLQTIIMILGVSFGLY